MNSKKLIYLAAFCCLISAVFTSCSEADDIKLNSDTLLSLQILDVEQPLSRFDTPNNQWTDGDIVYAEYTRKDNQPIEKPAKFVYDGTSESWKIVTAVYAADIQSVSKLYSYGGAESDPYSETATEFDQSSSQAYSSFDYLESSECNYDPSTGSITGTMQHTRTDFVIDIQYTVSANAMGTPYDKPSVVLMPKKPAMKMNINGKELNMYCIANRDTEVAKTTFRAIATPDDIASALSSSTEITATLYEGESDLQLGRLTFSPAANSKFEGTRIVVNAQYKNRLLVITRVGIGDYTDTNLSGSTELIEPIKISDATELMNFLSNGMGETVRNVILTDNISLEGATLSSSSAMSLNDGDIAYFNGNGHTISNFKVEATQDQAFVGFFNLTGASVTIKNLTLDNFTITVLPKADEADAPTFFNCGGISGGANGNFENCKVTNFTINANVETEGANQVGGICGSPNGAIIACEASNGTIITSGGNEMLVCGGIAGDTTDPIIACYSTNVNITAAGNMVAVGGITGFHQGIGEANGLYGSYSNNCTLGYEATILGVTGGISGATIKGASVLMENYWYSTSTSCGIGAEIAFTSTNDIDITNTTFGSNDNGTTSVSSWSTAKDNMNAVLKGSGWQWTTVGATEDKPLILIPEQ